MAEVMSDGNRSVCPICLRPVPARHETRGDDVFLAKVLTDKTDIAYALVEFESGCLAELDVSRVAAERERSMRVFDGAINTYFSADLNNRKLKKMFYRDGKLVNHPIPVEDRDQLEAEIGCFLDSILADKPVVVSGEAGLKALRYTKLISEMAESGKCFTQF